MTQQDGVPNSLAGFRLVRKLGVGSRADVFLGSGQTGTVVLKVFHTDVTAASIGAELDALGRADSPHLARLVDVATSDRDIPIPILERVQRGSVTALLRDRDQLEAGEVVTLLAPLAAALPGLHRSGVGHGRIGASNLFIGAGGEPVLIGFGHCALFPRDGSIAAIDAEPAAAQDRNDLAALAIALLSHVRDAAVDPRVLGLVEWIDAASREYEFVERLESRLFDFADPTAIEFRRVQSAESTGSAVPARISFPDPIEPRVAPTFASVVRPRQIVGDTLEAPVAPTRMLDRIEALLHDNPIDIVRSRAVAFVRGVRKPFWIAAGAVVLALTVTLSLLPQNAPAAAPLPRVTATSFVRAAPATSAPLPADPVQALPILLARRTRCVRTMSILCLDGVDDQSSSAYAADAALIQQLQGGTEIPKSAIITTLTPGLVETLGNSALVSLGPNSSPALVLLIRVGAGWRIRGYLSGVAATASTTAPNQ